MRRFLVAGVIAGAALVISAAPVAAAYPPGTATFLGTFTPGQSASTTAAGFKAGSAVDFAVNGTPDGSGVAASDGSVVLAISITDPHVAVNGNAPVSVGYGTTTVTADGDSPTGAPIADTVTLTIVQTAAPTSARPAAPITASPSLAFTGADIAAMVVGGLALIAVGSFVIVATRRRARRRREAA